MSSLLLNGEQQYLDGNGNPLVSGKVYFYEANTSTPKNTYQDFGLTVLNANPVILDGAGRATIWGSGSYRQVLADSDDNVIWDKTITDASYISDGSLSIGKLEDLSANVVLGAITAGPPVEITFTSAGRNIAGAATASAQRTLLGLGTSATLNTGSAVGNVVTWTASTSVLAFGAGAVGAPSITFTGDTDTGIYQIAGGQIGFSTNGVLRWKMDSTGNVGIGDFSGPTVGSALLVRFSADGTVQQCSDNAAIFSKFNGSGKTVAFRSGTTEVGSISVSGSATAYNTSSDYRLKENIKSIDDSTRKVLQLKPCEFNFRNCKETITGFIAHEVQTVIPNAVTGEKDGEEMQAVDYSKLIPILTAALQDALNRIESLENARL